MRKKIVAGNWKMNKNFQEAEDLLDEILELMEDEQTDNPQMILCTPFPYLELATDMMDECHPKIGAQNVSEYEDGAYTGEVSCSMLKSIDVEYCIIGHSERRKYFNESAESMTKKIDLLLDQGITPIYCCGEVLEEREANKQFEVVKAQIQECLFHLNADELQNLVIAYEPVWAIGTGKTASSDQAQEMHAFIRNLLNEKFGKAVADEITILYGGSCNAQNARELFANADVDGGLIGGASLKAEDFYKIYKSF